MFGFKKIEHFLGFGNSNSKTVTNTTTNQDFITRNDLNSFNEKLTNIASETMINTSKKCSNSTVLQNVIDFSDSIIKGDFTLDNVKLDQDSLTTLNCVQASTARIDVATSLISSIMEEFNTNTSNNLLTELESTAEAQASLGFLDFGNTQSSSKTNTTVNTKVLNENTKNLQNLVENAVSANVTEEDMQECINKVNMIQGIDASGAIIGGSVDISNYESAQVSTNVSECIQNSNMVSSTTQDIVSALGIAVSETSETLSGVETQSSSTSGTGQMDIGTIIVLVVVCICVVIGVVVMNKLMKNKGH